jgi:hypothetical protein
MNPSGRSRKAIMAEMANLIMASAGLCSNDADSGIGKTGECRSAAGCAA